MISNTIMTLDLENAFTEAFLLSLDIAGYEALRATNIPDALMMASSHSPDVLLLSANFEDIRNVDLVREFARHAERMECVLVCDTIDLMILAELYDSGNVYSHRPRPRGDHADIHRDIARAMERSAMRRQNGYLLIQLRDAREELHKLTEYMSFVENRIASAKISEDMLGNTGVALLDVLEILERIEKSAVHHKVKSDIASSRERVRSLLNATQYFTEILSPHNGLDTLLDIHIALNSVLDSLDGLFHKRGISLRTSYCRNSLSLAVNEKSLHQALIHIILNAIQAMQDGGVLEIETEKIEGDPSGVQIVIKDSGKGIPEDVMPYVYEPFFTTHSLRDGTGLGLTIAKAIIEEHDGTLAVTSASGEGTTIKITFPSAMKESPPAKLRVETVGGGDKMENGNGERHSHFCGCRINVE